MATIKKENIKRIEKNSYYQHKDVVATYSSFTEEGKKYFQIDTYGQSDRLMPDKISQTIQFDVETAKFLIQLLVDEFDLLR